jgi:hypothetical protein
MDKIRVAAFIGSSVHEVSISLRDVEAGIRAVDGEFDSGGVPKDRWSRKRQTAERVRALTGRLGRPGFDEVAHLICYARYKNCGPFTGTYGLVSILFDDAYVDDMHVVACGSATEYVAFIESVQQIVDDLFRRDGAGRTVLPLSRGVPACTPMGVSGLPRAHILSPAPDAARRVTEGAPG